MPECDEFYMRAALDVARRGLGQTWPNPAVGCVIVHPGAIPEIRARGWTAKRGRPHAERIALDKLGGQAKDCTLYVTLEPCAHHGQTPPCAEAIAASGITRVVCSIEDPDPRVSGRGFAILRNAGIAVTPGVLEQEGRQLTLGHILRSTQKRPFVQLKIAVGSDGRVPRGDGKPVWVTGPEARGHGHLLRARADAILVGSGTVTADNPSLTCRLPGMAEASPVRIVLDSKGQTPQTSQLMKTIDSAPLWIMTAQDLNPDAQQGFKDIGADVLAVPKDKKIGLLDLEIALREIAQRGITRLLVEGGPTVAARFWESNLVDEVHVYTGAERAGEGGIVPFDGRGIDAVMQDDRFEMVEMRSVGRDEWRRLRRKQA